MSVVPASPGRSWAFAFAVLAVYVAASAALTWPIAARPGEVLFGDYGDTRGWAAWLWAKVHGLLDGAANPMLAAPFGMPTANPVRHPVPEVLALAWTKLAGEIAAMNVLVLIAFPATAFATYLVLHRLLRDRSAAFIGGLAFGFCPAAVMQAAGGHVLYALNVFLPLLLLALVYNRARRTWFSAFLVAASYAGVVLTAIYLGYFAAVAAVYFVAFDLATRGDEGAIRILRNYAACAMLALLLLVPAEYGVIGEQLAASSQPVDLSGRLHDFGELSIYAARPWNYVVPSLDHPVLGGMVARFVRQHLEGSNAFEQTLYLGFVPLGLLVTGCAMAALGRFEPDLRRWFFVFALGAAWMYFVSLPPTIGAGVPTVSFFAHDLLPMFRVYARAGIVVALFVACAAAVVLANLHRRMQPRRYRAMVAILLSLLAFEYLSVPPSYALHVDNPPPVYGWLAQQPGDAIVAEYPMMRFDDAAFYTYSFWQRVHGKRLVNGATPSNAPAWRAYEQVRDLGDPETPRRLRALGVKYVILHKRMYGEGPIPATLKRYYSPQQANARYNGGAAPALPQELRLERSFGSDLVFVFQEAP